MSTNTTAGPRHYIYKDADRAIGIFYTRGDNQLHMTLPGQRLDVPLQGREDLAMRFGILLGMAGIKPTDSNCSYYLRILDNIMGVASLLQQGDLREGEHLLFKYRLHRVILSAGGQSIRHNQSFIPVDEDTLLMDIEHIASRVSDSIDAVYDQGTPPTRKQISDEIYTTLQSIRTSV